MSAGGAQGRWRSSGEGKNFWDELNGRGEVFGERQGIFGRKGKCLKGGGFVCSVFLSVLDKESISKVLANK